MNNSTALQIFKNEEFGQIRTIMKDGEMWFVGKDVADILGYSNSRKALIDHVDLNDKNIVTLSDGIRGNPNKTIINKSGVYSLVLSSKLPKAKEFKHWVTSEVLPKIEKHGEYTLEDIYSNFNIPRTYPDALRLAAKCLEENEQLKAEKQIMLPKAKAYQMLIDSKNNQFMNTFAKAMNWGRNRLYKVLREKKIFTESAPIPYQKYIREGYFVVKYTYKNGASYPFTMITPKGMDYIVRKIQEWGIYDELMGGDIENAMFGYFVGNNVLLRQ